MPTSNHAAIRARVDAFVEDLSTLIRQAALEAVQEALGGRATRTAAPVPARAAAGPRRKKARRKRPGGGKSVAPATALAALQAAGGPVLAEKIASTLGTNSTALRPTLEELMASGHVKRAGKKRGTTYEAVSGGGGGAAPATKKAAKKRSKKAGRKKANGK